jgi:two-component system, sensor histidine kinase
MASKRRISRSGAKRVTAAPRKRPAKTGAKTAAKGVRGPKASRQQSVVEAVLATFAHEVRTPLTGILAISDLLATSELGERERQWVDTIKANAEHLAALATVFVDAARSQSTGLSLRKDFFDLRVLTRPIRSAAGRPRRDCRRKSSWRTTCRRS